MGEYLKNKTKKNKKQKSKRLKRKSLRLKHGEEKYPITKFSLDNTTNMSDPTNRNNKNMAKFNEKAKSKNLANLSETDEFSVHNSENKKPKILITKNRNIKKSFKHSSDDFIKELLSVFPNSTYYQRNDESTVKDIVSASIKKDFTAILIVNQNAKLIRL